MLPMSLKEYRDFKQWLYRGPRPNWIARILNRAWAAVASWGLASNYLVTLEVTGRKSGRIVPGRIVLRTSFALLASALVRQARLRWFSERGRLLSTGVPMHNRGGYATYTYGHRGSICNFIARARCASSKSLSRSALIPLHPATTCADHV